MQSSMTSSVKKEQCTNKRKWHRQLTRPIFWRVWKMRPVDETRFYLKFCAVCTKFWPNDEQQEAGRGPGKEAIPIIIVIFLYVLSLLQLYCFNTQKYYVRPNLTNDSTNFWHLSDNLKKEDPIWFYMYIGYYYRRSGNFCIKIICS